MCKIVKLVINNICLVKLQNYIIRVIILKTGKNDIFYTTSGIYS